MAFKVLHCLLVFSRRSLCLESAEISSLPRLRIFLAGIQPILAGFQLPDHKPIEYSQTDQAPRVGLQGNRFGYQICHPQANRLPYEALVERLETQSRTSAARIVRFVARCAGRLQCWLA